MTRQEIHEALNNQQVLELLDNVSAAFETVMWQFGDLMYPADKASRSELVKQARQLCDSLLRPNDQDDVH